MRGHPTPVAGEARELVHPLVETLARRRRRREASDTDLPRQRSRCTPQPAFHETAARPSSSATRRACPLRFTRSGLVPAGAFREGGRRNRHLAAAMPTVLQSAAVVPRMLTLPSLVDDLGVTMGVHDAWGQRGSADDRRPWGWQGHAGSRVAAQYRIADTPAVTCGQRVRSRRRICRSRDAGRLGSNRSAGRRTGAAGSSASCPATQVSACPGKPRRPRCRQGSLLRG